MDPGGVVKYDAIFDKLEEIWLEGMSEIF